jgi:hypothetical protein
MKQLIEVVQETDFVQKESGGGWDDFEAIYLGGDRL